MRKPHKHSAAHGKMKKYSSRVDKYGILCVVLSILIPPLGLFLTLRSDWSRNAKYSLAALAVASFALMVVLIPDPDVRATGGVQMVGTTRETEIYGPELPTGMTSDYVAPVSDSVLAEDEVSEETTYVYAMPGAKCYHLSTCSYAYNSAQKLTVYEAHYMGYDPCKLCNPPEYVAGT